MELPRNSVWSVNDSELLEDGLYRLLDIMLEDKKVHQVEIKIKV